MSFMLINMSLVSCIGPRPLASDQYRYPRTCSLANAKSLDHNIIVLTQTKIEQSYEVLALSHMQSCKAQTNSMEHEVWQYEITSQELWN